MGQPGQDSFVGNNHWLRNVRNTVNDMGIFHNLDFVLYRARGRVVNYSKNTPGGKELYISARSKSVTQ